jgi:hypothetical protein
MQRKITLQQAISEIPRPRWYDSRLELLNVFGQFACV